MEKLPDYTCKGAYTASWNKLMAEQNGFMERIRGNFPLAAVSGFGEINIAHLWGVNADAVQAAYDLKMRMAAYWEVVTGRMVDNTVLHLLFSIGKVVNKEIIDEVVGPRGNGLERMLDELPSVGDREEEEAAEQRRLAQAV